MNPVIVILGFVVLLGILLYYLQGRDGKLEIMPTSEEEPKEDKTVIKAKDYQAKYEKEMKEKPEERKVEEENEPTVEEVKEEVETNVPETVEENVEDIIEIDGIGPKFKELLIAIGYDSIEKISEADPEVLYEKLIEANEDKEITKRPPTLVEVEQWVEEAKSL